MLKTQHSKTVRYVGLLVAMVMLSARQLVQIAERSVVGAEVVRRLEMVDPVEWPTCQFWTVVPGSNVDGQNTLGASIANPPRLRALALAQSGQCYLAANLLESSLQSVSKADTFLIGRWYLASGYREQAVAVFRKGDLVNELQIVANAAKAHDRPELALRWMDLAFEVAPDRSLASNLSGVYLSIGMRDEAISVWKRLALASSSETDRWVARAEESCLRGDVIAVNEAFDHAITLSPLDASLFIEYANCLHKMGGHLDTELRVLNQACSLRDATGCLYLGYIYSNLSEYEQAISAYTQSLRIDPSDPKPKCGIGEILLKQGYLDRAESALRDTISHHPGHYCGYEGLARVLYIQGRLCDAISSLEKAVDTNRHVGGRPIEWLFSLVDWYVESGQVAKANLAYEQILSWEPNNEQAVSGESSLMKTRHVLEVCH